MRTFLLLLAVVCGLPLWASAQTLALSNDVQTYATLTNTAVTLTGKSELRITGAGDPLVGCTVNLTSPDAWFFMTSVWPSTVSSTFLSRIKVNGVAAVLDGNVRVVQFAGGSVVIPHAPDFAPVQVFDGKYFTGPTKFLKQYTDYGDALLGPFKSAISSFKLKRGYMATFATNPDGTGTSRCYVAQDGDLEVGALPAAMDNAIRFVRIFKWRWTAKKGIAGNIGDSTKARWRYNWNLDQNSTPDREYVAIRQTQYWPGLTGQNWSARGINHVLGYNEPDHTDQANMTVAQAIAGWPDLLGTGLRVGAPAVSDGGVSSWLYPFIDAADAAGLRVDFIPVHYYRSYSSASNASGAASQLYNFIKAIHDRTGRPIWLTEFNNGANWTTDPDPSAAQQAATVAAMVAMLDSTPFVERYAIYNWVEDVRRVEWDDGSLTAAGISYRDEPSPTFYFQEMADRGAGTTAAYPFDGDGHDAVGNGQDAMFVGTPTFTTGKFGQAISLDGANDYLQLSPRLADSTDFTFAGWIYWNGGGDWQRIFDFAADTNSFLALTPKAGSAGLRFILKVAGTEQLLNAAALPTATWTHVAVTLSGSTGKLFVNGALVNTNTAMTFNPVDVGTKFNYLGRSQFAADPLFNGRLDDLHFTSVALSDAQIAAMAAGGPPLFSASILNRAGAVRGQPFTGSLSGDATGGVGGVRTFSKISGPAWLAVAVDGTLTGVPGAGDGGTNEFEVRASDNTLGMTTAVLRIAVAEPAGLMTRLPFDSNTTAAVGLFNGTASGSPVYAAGRYGGAAIDLDGGDDFVTLPQGAARFDSITVAAWVNWDGGSAWQRIFDFGNGTTQYLLLTPKSASNTLRFTITNESPEQTLNTPTLAIGQWVHVAVTLGSGIGKLYVNGVLADTQSITIKPGDFDPAYNYIGKSQFSADPFFNGRVDEFLIFNQVLPASQIAALAIGRPPVFSSDPLSKPAATAGQIYEQTLAGSATDPDAGSVLTYGKVSGPKWLTVSGDGRISGVPAASDAGLNRFVVRVTDGAGLADDATLNIVVPASSGLIAQYQFDSTLSDSIAGTTGTAVGTPVYVAGLFDKALAFNGTTDSVSLPASAAATLVDCTFATRVRWDGGAAWQRIFDFGNGASNYFMLSPSSGSGVVHFGICVGGVGQTLAGTSPLPVGEWAHVAVTLSGTTGTLYVNGAAVTSGTITFDPAAVPQTLNFLGDSQFAADPAFNGALDDFRIYNRALSAAEIAALAAPVSATAVSDSQYPAWVTANALTGLKAGAPADADTDGLPNVWEYLSGTNPALSASGAPLLPQVRSAADLGLGNTGKTYLTLQARVLKRHLGTTFVPEAAATLEGLALPDAATHTKQAGSPVTDGAFDIFTYYFDTPLENLPAGSGFIRLRLNVN